MQRLIVIKYYVKQIAIRYLFKILPLNYNFVIEKEILYQGINIKIVNIIFQI